MTNDTELRESVRRAWDTIAGWWDEKIGPEGNTFHRTLIEPTTLEPLELREEDEVLEIACGNGAFARRMAAEGARVLATDFSAEFLDRAREHRAEHSHRIEYRLVDATDESQLAALGEGRFDAIVCNMALMDMA
jgi:2-polyprenyl-3-methyl-5-hydroxy-6-metoxy-1,4-benzoquinol methylase